METIFMNTEKDKTTEPQNFVLNLAQRLDLNLEVLTNMFFFKIYQSIYLEEYKKEYKRIQSNIPGRI